MSSKIEKQPDLKIEVPEESSHAEDDDAHDSHSDCESDEPTLAIPDPKKKRTTHATHKSTGRIYLIPSNFSEVIKREFLNILHNAVLRKHHRNTFEIRLRVASWYAEKYGLDVTKVSVSDKFVRNWMKREGLETNYVLGVNLLKTQ
jgi:hypothetical protein